MFSRLEVALYSFVIIAVPTDFKHVLDKCNLRHVCPHHGSIRFSNQSRIAHRLQSCFYDFSDHKVIRFYYLQILVIKINFKLLFYFQLSLSISDGDQETQSYHYGLIFNHICDLFTRLDHPTGIPICH